MSGKKKKTKAHGPLKLGWKIRGMLRERFPMMDGRRLLMLNIPYIIIFYMADKAAWLFRHCTGDSLTEKAGVLFLNFQMAFDSPLPSIHEHDLLAGAAGAAAVKLAVYMKGKNAKKYRQGEEYGSAR